MPGMQRRRVALAGACTLVMAAVLATVMLTAGGPAVSRQPLHTGSHTRAVLGRQAPRPLAAQEPSPSLQTVTATTQWTQWAQPSCEARFFSSLDAAAIKHQFGHTTCEGFHLGTSTYWVVIGFGPTPAINYWTPTGTVPGVRATDPAGGSMVAVLACPHADARCDDPDSQHAFSSFTVYPSPVSTSGLQVPNSDQMTPYVPLAYFGCEFWFDPLAPAWYYDYSIRSDTPPLHTGVVPLSAPAPVSGTAALSKAAPRPTIENCGQPVSS
jgi:hypothetical protein